MFKGYKSHAIIACPNDAGTVDLYKWKYVAEDINLISESISPTYFYIYFGKNKHSVAETDHDSSRIVLTNADKKRIDITIQLKGTATTTTVNTKYESRFVITRDIIKLNLNSYPIKKICAIDGRYVIMILTMNGKLFALDNFDSDVEHDLSNSEIIFPNQTFVVDIDCNYSSFVALSDAGEVYKINVDPDDIEDGKPLMVPVKPFNNPVISEIKCQYYRTIYRDTNGQFYADDILGQYDTLVKLDKFSGLDIVKFECSNYNILALDRNDDLYSVYIEEYGQEIDEVPTKFPHKVQPIPRFANTKSANKL